MGADIQTRYGLWLDGQRPEPRYLLQDATGDRKTGRIAATYAPRSTCPPSCGFYTKGCYALAGFRTAHTWARISVPGADGLEGRAEHPQVASADAGETWDNVLAWVPLAVRRSPHGLLRWGIAGDLPGDGERVDALKTADLVRTVDRAGGQLIAYTHRSDPETLALAMWARDLGQALNVSCDHAGESDAVMSTGLPCVTVMPHAPTVDGKPWKTDRTPEGKPIVQCPAEWSEGVQCVTCGNGRPLCSRAERTYAVGFSAHGTAKKAARLVVLGRGGR